MSRAKGRHETGTVAGAQAAETAAPVRSVGKCAECGGPAVTGEPGALRGPVLSQIDAVDLPVEDRQRCVPCWEKVKTGVIITRVPGSSASAFFGYDRARLAAKAADNKAGMLYAWWKMQEIHHKVADVIFAMQRRDFDREMAALMAEQGKDWYTQGGMEDAFKGMIPQ